MILGIFHQKWPFLVKTRVPPRETSKIPRMYGKFSGVFGGFFPKFWDFGGFWGFFGVPVIKEEKAIALRSIDIVLFV